jgi:hypothetical protein
MSKVSIIDAVRDVNLFGHFFGRGLKSWRRWLTVLRAIYGIPVRTGSGRDLIRRYCGRNPGKLPHDGFKTALLLCGRRSV